MIKLGIDLGGTKIEIAALNESNQILLRRRIPTEREFGYTAILERIVALYRTAIEEIGNVEHTLGIGIPGTLSQKSDLIKNSNTICFNGQPLLKDLCRRLQKNDIVMENDANCFALAESIMGAAQGSANMFGVIMGTGCGGGLIINGKLHSGRQRIAGEWGHMQIDPNGPQCYCGRRGCVETYISGGGLQTVYLQQFGVSRTVPQMLEKFRAKIEPDYSFVVEFFQHFGVAMANLITVLDPEMVVLGGGLSNIDELYTIGKAEVAKNIFSDELTTPIVRNKLGDSAGVFGAALLGTRESEILRQ